jgi:small conductance mechanosensitive channel
MHRPSWPVVVILVGLLGLAVSTPGWAQEPAPSDDEQSSLLAETEELEAALQLDKKDIDELIARFEEAEGEQRQVLGGQITRRGKEARANLDALVSNLNQLREEGREPAGPRATAEELLTWAIDFVRRELDHNAGLAAELRAEWANQPPEEKLAVEQRLSLLRTENIRLLVGFLDMCDYRERLGLDTSEDLSYLDGLIQEAAESMASRIDIARKQERDLTAQLQRVAAEDEPRMRAELVAVQERLHGTTTGLTAAVELMDRRGLDTAEYKQLLIQTTGSVTTDIFDTRVALGLIKQAWQTTKDWLATHGPQWALRALFFLLILAIFKLIAIIATRVLRRTVHRPDVKVPVLLRNMLVSITSKVIMILGLLIALSQVGVQVGPLLAGLGVAGFIVGFALQDSLSNFAAGMMILFYRPFDVGDVVEAGGAFGKVNHMSLVSTTILSFDNQTLIVPNRKIWGDVIKNVTAESIRRVDMSFRISHGDDIERAERVLREIIDGHELVLDDPEPIIRLHNLGESSLDFVVRPWVRRSDYWTVYWDITRSVKKSFDAEGISIPLPQRDVHIHQHPPSE